MQILTVKSLFYINISPYGKEYQIVLYDKNIASQCNLNDDCYH